MTVTNPNRRAFVKTAAAASVALSFPTVLSAQEEKGQLALLGGEPIRKTGFPSWPVIDQTDETNLMDALRRKEWCRLYGNITTTFEEQWAKMLGAKHAIGVTNGTSSLYAALFCVDVQPGDEVILSPYTFIATLNAVLQQYALPVFADTDPETFQMDATSVEERITEHTRCLLPVHIGGNVADMGAIMAIAQKHKLAVVEDACQAHFAEWDGKKAGAIGDIGCFSFQATKILPCGEGGAVVTSDEELWNRLHAFQNNGRDRVHGTRDGYQYQGGNLRMTELQAAILNAQLTRFEGQVQQRVENAAYLDHLLEDIPGIRPAKKSPGATLSTYYLYMVDYDSAEYNGISRGRYLEALRKEGIPAGGGYVPLNKEPIVEKMLNSRAYKRLYSEERLKAYWEKNHCPNNDKVCERAFWLSHEVLEGSKDDVEQIAQAMRKVYHNREALG
ncbi:MAG: DegT/DnrJ/EryC1/StrS family aminotransferase [bacterium]|jgi:dTDP-4-amino-4,6-dideoxygalactose transaminase|nr:DegT/DnrJ/EryC1/StrS family aminotransferase [bacterium]